jgi:hypothetical protein
MSLDLFMILNIFASALVVARLWSHHPIKALVGVAIYLGLFYLILGVVLTQAPELYTKPSFEVFRQR